MPRSTENWESLTQWRKPGGFSASRAFLFFEAKIKPRTAQTERGLSASRRKKQWRRMRDSDFFSYANKIKDLASHILVKIAQGHQKGHQKILKELTITNNELVKRVYRKRDESQFCQTSMMPFFTSSPVSLLKNALCELRQSLSRRSSAYVRDQCSSQWLIACELSNGLPYKALLCT